MEKIEYSDLNKFLVSIGLTLLIISFLLPWIYLRESFDLNITQNQISELTKTAQSVINLRQDFIFKTIHIVPFASIFLFILGVICIVIGLVRWIKKQRDLDEREKIITATHRYNFTQLTNAEVQEKAENEYFSLKQDNKLSIEDTVKKEDYIPKYLQLERGFFEKLMKFFYNDYRILSNYRIEDFEYDIILESRKQTKDYIFEIKYYPRRYSKSNLEDAILKLDKSTISYTNKTGRKAKPILIIIVHREDFNSKQLNDLNNFTSENLKELDNLDLGIITFDEFEDISKRQIENLLYNKGESINN